MDNQNLSPEVNTPSTRIDWLESLATQRPYGGLALESSEVLRLVREICSLRLIVESLDWDNIHTHYPYAQDCGPCKAYGELFPLAKCTP